MNKKFLLCGAVGCGIIFQTSVIVIAILLSRPSEKNSKEFGKALNGVNNAVPKIEK
jgi:hypothetical protein